MKIAVNDYQQTTSHEFDFEALDGARILAMTVTILNSQLQKVCAWGHHDVSQSVLTWWWYKLHCRLRVLMTTLILKIPAKYQCTDQ